MGLKLITPPITSPVSLEDARRQCGIYETDDSFDHLLQIYIDAAISHLDGNDGVLQRCLEPQVWQLLLDSFSASIEIKLGPVIEVDSIKYYDADSVLQTIDPLNYAVDTSQETAWIVPVSGYSWPSPASGINNVIVEYTAGYEGELDSASYVSGVPGAIRAAILLLVGHWFNQREAVSVGQAVAEVPFAVDALLKPYKRIVLA